MLANRSNPVVAIGLLVLLLGGPAAAQDLQYMQLFGPADTSSYGGGPQARQGYFFSFEGLNWAISPPDRMEYGYPGLSRVVVYSPRVEIEPEEEGEPLIVYPAVTRLHTNSHDTAPLAAEFTEGTRIEIGRVRGDAGWLCGVFHLHDQAQTQLGENVDVVFNEAGFEVGGIGPLQGYTAFFTGYGDLDQYIFPPVPVGQDPDALAKYYLPISFDELQVDNRVETWGVELMYLRRLGQGYHGGSFEFFAGVRYLEFNETTDFALRGTERVNSDNEPITTAAVNWRFVYDAGEDGDPTTTTPSIIGPGVVLADCFWLSEADNHVIGPQIGLRWHRKRGPWSVVAEGRFLAGLNVQNIRNHGVLGSELGAGSPWSGFDFGDQDVVGVHPYMLYLRDPYYFDNTAHIYEFSPAGELRVKFVYDLTRAVSVNIGWDGFWMGGIARGVAMPDWTIAQTSVMDVDRNNNDQTVFINGVTIGLTINR